MAKDYRKEISFQAGELSPLFYGRSETEFYQKGLAVAKNVTIDKRGGAFRRKGAQNRAQLAATANNARVWTKQIHPYRFDTLIIDGSSLNIISPGIGYTSANLLTDGLFETFGGGAWTSVVASADSRVVISNQVAKLLPQQNNGSQTAAVRQQVTVTGGTTNSHTVQVQQAFSDRIRIKVGTTAGGTEIADEYTNDEFYEFAFVPNNATYYVEVECDGDAAESATIVFVGTLLTANVGPDAEIFTSPFAEEELDEIQTVDTPDGETTYFLGQRRNPRKLTYDWATNTYTGLTSVSFTSQPSQWTGFNNPTCGTFFNGRLWLGGTPEQPQTVWASRSGSPEDFTTGAGDADSWNFTLQRQGRIRWMWGNKNLVIGSENGEHVVTSESGVLVQSDFEVQQQSSYGSAVQKAIQIGEKVFYITPDQRRVQSMAYAWQEDNWLSQDLTFASEHITAGLIRRVAWAQNPNNLLYLTLENGNIAVLTYDRTSETIGWTDLQYEGADVIDTAVGQIGGTSRLVYATQRSANEIEVEIETSVEVYLDSFAHKYHQTASDALSGLDHLEGEEVQVVVDGAVTEPQTVSGGAITAAVTGNDIYAGKMIESRVVTLPPDIPQDQIRSWDKRWNKTWALVHESVAPIINGKRPADRSPSTPMNTPEGRMSRAYKTVDLGWDENGQVTVEENLPVPMKLLAIYGELSRESL